MNHSYDNKEFVYDVLRTIAYYDINDFIIIRTNENGEPVFSVHCSDLHWWGVGYSVDITPENLETLKECLDYNETEGPLLFCCKVYNMRPQGAYYKHLDPNMWLAFDMTGPLRNNRGSLNPKLQKFTYETLQYNLEHYSNEMFEYFTYPYINYKGVVVVVE